MLQFSPEGVADLAAKLAALPDGLRAALAEKIDALAQDLLAQVVDVNLSGAVLNARSGALRNSIQLRNQDQGASLGVAVVADGGAPYAAIQEYGGKTAAHEIVPDKATVLAFIAGGKQAFARRVHHPGSEIPERSYLRSALAEKSAEIKQALRQTLAEAAQRAKDNP
ncbi:Bacteriophage HK97-gp10, putative tail-component [Rhodoblastus acidophilus]|uniref:Bacteriophage HK97-gp10, putative tail-component n=1 Tax=Rhodoblastus acidophilus TaxID=1074 RepID=A0A212QL88_RHOAC|nr:HK97 gp10 family phage protein [Rhodoblastus acidophilus]SNB60129.1 Bacteriophage HK97-gp10, putative tail-component [Rhodoblastus acidophilus]